MPLDNPAEETAVSEETGTVLEGQESEVVQEEASSTEGETSSEASEEVTPKEEEWYLPGEYRTKEEALNGLRYFRAEASRRANEIHRLKQEQKRSAPDPKREIEDFAEAVKRNPVEAVRDIVRGETKADREARQEREFANTYKSYMNNKEFAELEPVMTQIATEYEDMIQDSPLRNDPRLLNILFLAARGVKQEEKLRAASGAATKKGERGAIKKIKAQSEGGSGSQGHKAIDVASLSASEMKKLITTGKLKV